MPAHRFPVLTVVTPVNRRHWQGLAGKVVGHLLTEHGTLNLVELHVNETEILLVRLWDEELARVEEERE
jgi:hypothetical protein